MGLSASKRPPTPSPFTRTSPKTPSLRNLPAPLLGHFLVSGMVTDEFLLFISYPVDGICNSSPNKQNHSVLLFFLLPRKLRPRDIKLT